MMLNEAAATPLVVRLLDIDVSSLFEAKKKKTCPRQMMDRAGPAFRHFAHKEWRRVEGPHIHLVHHAGVYSSPGQDFRNWAQWSK